jgi:hypothetical protein
LSIYGDDYNGHTCLALVEEQDTPPPRMALHALWSCVQPPPPQPPDVEMTDALGSTYQQLVITERDFKQNEKTSFQRTHEI